MQFFSSPVKETFYQSKLLIKELTLIFGHGMILYFLTLLSPFSLIIPIIVTAGIVFLSVKKNNFGTLEELRNLARFSFLGSPVTITFTVLLPLKNPLPILIALAFFLEFLVIYSILTYIELRRIL
ncbi:hypothetical protein [Desulfurobacterium crinifex]